MEVQSLDIYHAKVDTSRPFRSVKEALTIFGEKQLVGETYVATSPDRESAYYSPSSQRSSVDGDDHRLDDAIKKLEVELREMKMELKMLEGSESETEVAMFSSNPEVQKNMLNETLANAAAMERTSSLAQEVSISEKKYILESKRKKKNVTKKHILLFMGNLLPRKKQSSTTNLQIEDKAAAFYHTTSN